VFCAGSVARIESYSRAGQLIEGAQVCAAAAVHSFATVVTARSIGPA
jgi:hypothetical protein